MPAAEMIPVVSLSLDVRYEVQKQPSIVDLHQIMQAIIQGWVIQLLIQLRRKSRYR